MEKATAPYPVTAVSASLAKDRSLNRRDYKLLAFVFILSVLIRCNNLAWPDSVVFDEVHFGGFARKYVIGRFFMDVHPPLAKMLFAVVAHLGGYDGEFTFETIGMSYVDQNVPYVMMRSLPALMGVGSIVLLYSTLKASGVRSQLCAVAALLLTFENTHATDSRYILLDSPLVFFIALTAYAFKKFENEVSFGRDWFRYLLLTGLGLATTVSSKWVGLFTIGWVGLLTLYQLWNLWGDRQVTLKAFGLHFGFRSLFLIAVPAAFYVGMFALHFFCVDNFGEGATFMPRAFQAHLKHNTIPSGIPLELGIGSEVTLRHMNSVGGYLHSHDSVYPGGSQQQQITLYPHLDLNNVWQIENGTEEWQPEGWQPTDIVHLKHDDIVRFRHVNSSHRLHSHDHRAPVTPHDYLNEVSAYGFEGFEGDANDNWRIKIVEGKSVGDGKKLVQPLRTVFQLEHVLSGCLLYSKDVRLPDWGFGQSEVACIRPGQGPNTYWFIEDNKHVNDPEPELISYPEMSFFAKFFELQKVMWNINKGLTEPHTWESRPLDWLWLRRGINMWGKDHRQVYLIGNLPVYWTLAALLLVFVVFKGVQLLIWQYQGGVQRVLTAGDLSAAASSAAQSPVYQVFNYNFATYALGWAFHYFPSFLMARQLFLHHYLASIYFGILMIGQGMELFVKRVPHFRLSSVVCALLLASSVLWYVYYSPLVYGTVWTKAQCSKSRFHDMDFECGLFLNNRTDYSAYDLTRTVQAPETVETDVNVIPQEDGNEDHIAAQDIEEVKPHAPPAGETVPGQFDVDLEELNFIETLLDESETPDVAEAIPEIPGQQETA